MINHYLKPKITPIALDGSLKYGVVLKTKIWNKNNSNLKFELEITAETEELAKYKLKSFLGNQSLMHEWV